MTQRIDPNVCPVQDPYRLFGAILQSVTDECVANLRQHIQQLSTRRLENVCSEELVRRQRARAEAGLRESAERAAQDRAEQAESRARALADRSLAQPR